MYMFPLTPCCMHKMTRTFKLDYSGIGFLCVFSTIPKTTTGYTQSYLYFSQTALTNKCT